MHTDELETLVVALVQIALNSMQVDTHVCIYLEPGGYLTDLCTTYFYRETQANGKHHHNAPTTNT